MEKKASKRKGGPREFDFSNGVRGKYAKRFAEGTNLVLLDPDLREVFPDSKSVNEVLRPIAAIVRSRVGS